MESYKDFAAIYDSLMTDVNYNDWFNYIMRIFNKYGKNPNRILEMACGTGNLTEHLCREDFEVTCFDISEDMLSIAYDKLSKYKNVRIINQDMVSFKFNEKFDAVICTCDSINYVVNKEDLIKVFENVYTHLNDNGMFIFDINSYYKLKYIIGDNVFINDTDNVFYIWDNSYDKENDICEFYLTFFVKDKDKDKYKRFDERHLQKAYTTENIVEALQKSGFITIDVYEAFGFNKPSGDSDRINFVAFK